MAELENELFADVTEAEGAEPEAPEITPEQVAEDQPEPEQPREAVAEPAPTNEPQHQRPEAGFVPIAAMMDERDKRRALEAQLAEYQRQQAAQPAAPDPFDDPQGFAQYQNAQVEQRLTQERFAFSDRFARKEYGAETVDKAVQWAQERAQQDPVFAQSYMRESDPIDWIVQQHKRDSMISQIGNRSMDDFVRDYLAQNPGLISQTAPVAAAPVAVTPQQATPPVKVPRSLATQGSGPSDVRDVATGALAAVDAVFPQ